MHILIITDAWHPQVNGVVRSLEHMMAEAEPLGAQFSIISPADFKSVPMPGYSEIRLALTTYKQVKKKIEAIGAEYIHIATEGPLGMLARRWCLKHKYPFTTGYHTKFPEYVRARLPIPTRFSYAWLRRFHNKGNAVLVPTPSVQQELGARGFTNVKIWGRGVDTEMFKPQPSTITAERPIFIYIGRVSVEKNIEAFLNLQLPGSKVVVGDGPALQRLKSAFPDVQFMGKHTGPALAAFYASADVFVFPSLTDTFGLVILEALACGVPVAAFPVTGPKDIIQNGVTGILNEDLQIAALEALALNRDACRTFAERNSWRASAESFMHILEKAQSIA